MTSKDALLIKLAPLMIGDQPVWAQVTKEISHA